MKNLYAENPIKIMDKIETIEEVYRNKNEHSKKKQNTLETLDMEKNLSKEEEKEKDKEKSIYNNDLLSKSNSQKSTNIRKTFALNMKSTMQENIKTIISDDDKYNNNNSSNNNIDKNDYGSLNISKINEKATFSNKKLKLSQFTNIVLSEYIILFFPFILYFIYSIIMLILIILGIQRLYYLIDYVKYNDYIDGYIYDNANAIIYIIDTNSSSFYYGNLINSSYNKDYIQENIDLLYDAIINKDDIEQNKEPIFKPVGSLINMNCSSGITQDQSLMSITQRFNVSFDEYFGALCEEFPVAQTGESTSVFYEIIYLVGRIYRKYESSDSFYNIFEYNLNQTQLFELFTLTMTFLRIRRNVFYESIIMQEVNQIIDYFSRLILIYLIICIIFEVVIFLLIYCGIIKQVRKKDNLFSNFIDSFRYD
jgi:hypothetical protein